MAVRATACYWPVIHSFRGAKTFVCQPVDRADNARGMRLLYSAHLMRCPGPITVNPVECWLGVEGPLDPCCREADRRLEQGTWDVSVTAEGYPLRYYQVEVGPGESIRWVRPMPLFLDY